MQGENPATAPDGILQQEWDSLRAGTLAELHKSRCWSDLHLHRICRELETNQSLVTLTNPDDGTSNTVETSLASAIVKSRNPNFLHHAMIGTALANEHFSVSTSPPEIDQLNALCRYNHRKAGELLDKMQADPAALTSEDVAQIRRRAPAIADIARHERGLGEPDITGLLGKLPPAEEASMPAKPPFDAGLEAALAPFAEPSRPSKLRQVVDGAKFAGLMVYGAAASIAKDRQHRREAERRGKSSPDSVERS